MIPLFFSILSGLLLIPCFPKYDLEFLAWFALVPLLLAIKNKGQKSSFCHCFLTGFIFFCGVTYWLNEVTGIKLIDFLFIGIVLIAGYFGIFGLVFSFIVKKTKFPIIVIAPLLWVSIEYLRSHAGFLGFPWALMGHSQYKNIPIIQISSFTGVYGVSFIIMMVNAVICEVICNRLKAYKSIITMVIIIGVSYSYGIVIMKKDTVKDKKNITVIQPNIAQEIKWQPEYMEENLKEHVDLSISASKDNNTELIIWPETATGSIRQDDYLRHTILSLAKEINTPLLIGSSQYAKFGASDLQEEMFNEAIFISSSGKIAEQYNKILLLPFVEYLPYKETFPWPSRFFTNANYFQSGTEYTIFKLNDTKFGVVVCWESTAPEIFRRFVKKGANFMINISNEAMFGDTAAPYHFASMVVFRAVENRIYIARSANTGISCFINPYGIITKHVGDNNNVTFVKGHLTSKISITGKKTFYTMYGDIFIYTCIGIVMIMLAFSLTKSESISTSIN